MVETGQADTQRRRNRSVSARSGEAKSTPNQGAVMANKPCETCGTPLVFTPIIRKKGRVIRHPRGGVFVFCPKGCKRT